MIVGFGVNRELFSLRKLLVVVGELVLFCIACTTVHYPLSYFTHDVHALANQSTTSNGRRENTISNREEETRRRFAKGRKIQIIMIHRVYFFEQRQHNLSLIHI